jgi:hypothetical protein
VFRQRDRRGLADDNGGLACGLMHRIHDVSGARFRLCQLPL